jgi:hypothetical protein
MTQEKQVRNRRRYRKYKETRPMTDTEPKQPDRRLFMKLAGLGAAGASIGFAASEASATEASAAEHGGYRETEHVKAYYKMARF